MARSSDGARSPSTITTEMAERESAWDLTLNLQERIPLEKTAAAAAAATLPNFQFSLG